MLSNPVRWVDALGLKIVWKKRNGASDEDAVKAKGVLETAKKRRNPHGTKGEGVVSIEIVEGSDKIVTIEVGKGGNSHESDSEEDAGNGKGCGATIEFDPNKTGPLPDGTPRDPEASLVHEIHHARRAVEGKEPSSLEDKETDAGSVENEHRRNTGLPQRKTYGVGGQGGHSDNIHRLLEAVQQRLPPAAQMTTHLAQPSQQQRPAAMEVTVHDTKTKIDDSRPEG